LKDPVVYTHKELVEASKAGLRKAQFQLYDLYVDAMYSVSFRMLGRREDAEDVVQDAFTEAFTKLKQFRYDSSFGAWLKRIVVNRSLNFLRDRKIVFSEWEKSANQVADKNEFFTEPDQDRTFSLSKVKAAITQLPHGYRQIINLYLVEGYDHIEIGEILNISNGTSKSQYHRAKKKLLEIVNTL